ncbi:hypothetical protein M9Y10_010325 [Tritrichomonas musculus]|uniref:Uncharacterized protein n=1 Tax=Tritrichomonas musculus TaxID=1915356 RepID=A0ABR2ILL5_9EUKA
MDSLYSILKDKDLPKDQQQAAFVQQEVQNYIEGEKKLYDNLLTFLENSDSETNDLKHLFQINNNYQDECEREHFKQYLQLITNFANNHNRQENLLHKIFQILQYHINEIKQTFSNSELFNIFESNKLILLFLFEN